MQIYRFVESREWGKCWNLKTVPQFDRLSCCTRMHEQVSKRTRAHACPRTFKGFMKTQGLRAWLEWVHFGTSALKHARGRSLRKLHLDALNGFRHTKRRYMLASHYHAWGRTLGNCNDKRSIGDRKKRGFLDQYCGLGSFRIDHRYSNLTSALGIMKNEYLICNREDDWKIKSRIWVIIILLNQ